MNNSAATITVLPEHTEVAKQLIRLYAEYVEGFIDSSIISYNAILRTVGLRTIEELVRLTPFEHHSLQLVSRVGDLFSNRQDVWDKVISDLAKAKALKAKINTTTFDEYIDRVEELIAIKNGK